jgi:Flp pilus assembly protein TadD
MRGALALGVLALSLLGSGILPTKSEAAPEVISNEIPPEVLSLRKEAEKSFVAGNLQKADSLYSRALGVVPNNPSLLVSAAAVKTRLGKLDESRRMLREALSLDLDNAAAWKLLGMNALEQKRDEEAFACLAQATLHDETNPRAHNYLGMAAGRKGWGEASEQELRRAVELDPNYADANFNLAVLYLGRTPPLVELARRHYQRALDLGAQRDSAIENLIAKAVASQPTDSPKSVLP